MNMQFVDVARTKRDDSTEETQMERPPTGETAARKGWMSVLAKARADDVVAAWECLDEKPQYRPLRGPETGLVMVQARAGGVGAKFNFGEMTVTRCSVELEDGTVGHAYIPGADGGHAEAAAMLDAMLQDGARRASLMDAIVSPLAAAHAERHRTRAMKTAATRVDFFTLVRGDSE